MSQHKKSDSRVAVVTGGRRGIGQAICLRLARAGHDVAIVDLDDASETVRAVEALGHRAKAYVADVSSAEDVHRIVGQILADFGRIDILVNDAGIGDMAPFLDTSEDLWDRTLDVNLKGVFLFSQEVARHMKGRRFGKIVNIHSNAAILGYEELSAYCASKGGGMALTKAMAVELGPYNINVNGVGPGTVMTEMSREYLKGDRARAEIEATPLRRLGTPEDVAGLVAFLVSDEAGWITGQTIYIDGGYCINGTSAF